MRILLCEDDPIIARNATEILTNAGYAVTTVGTAAEATTYLLSEEADCAILDRGLPDGDGLSVVTSLRTHNISVPILLLTAYSAPQEKVAGLNSGADDYLAKPYEPAELMARVRALIRRGTGAARLPILTFGALAIDTNTRTVTAAGKTVELSPKEYALLEYLAYHPCQALDRVTILTHAWDENIDLFSNTVDVHIRYLRRKLGKTGSLLIRTVKGKGYMLCAA